ncbi:MAG: glutamate--tRNA ligase family protein, partial [Candidatus Eisenbacteria bacterium]
MILDHGDKVVRVRCSIRPTGPLRVTDLRMLVLSWLYSRQNEGDLILRIDDIHVDQDKPAAWENPMLEDLDWMGITYEEGPTPSAGDRGPFAPYRQSLRPGQYLDAIKLLIGDQRAYLCLCHDNDCRCRHNPVPDIDTLVQSKSPFKIRLHVPDHEIRMKDIVKKDVVIDSGKLRQIDNLIVFEDGEPSHEFASAVDDWMMSVTHILTAEADLYDATMKQLVIREALGHETLETGHVPPLLGVNGEHVADNEFVNTTIASLREGGYLAPAIVFHLILPQTEIEESVSSEGLSHLFRIDYFSGGDSIYNPDRLKWINGRYLESMGLSDMFHQMLPLLVESGYSMSDTTR